MNVSAAFLVGLGTLTVAAIIGVWYVITALRDWYTIAHGVELLAFVVVALVLAPITAYAVLLLAFVWLLVVGAL